VNLHDRGEVRSMPQHKGGGGKASVRQLTERGHRRQFDSSMVVLWQREREFDGS
jgi:hypothetical protein